MTVRRGEVRLAALPGQKPRPAIVLTVDWLSQFALYVMVVPVTSVARGNFPTRVEIPAGEGGLRIRSWAKCDQITTVVKSALAAAAFGRVSARKMAEVDDAVRLAVGL